MKNMCLIVVPVGIFALFFFPFTAVAQLNSFGVLGGSTVTNTATPSSVSGNLGVSPGSAVTGFPPGVVTGGSIHAADVAAGQAQTSLTTLYNQLAGTACNTVLTGQNLGGLTLTPGVYCFATSAQLTGTLTLDAQGDPNAVFVFQIGSTLTTASASSVLLINNASSCGVFWQVGSAATLGTGTALVGSIVALTSITLNSGASVAGRTFARNGAVTLDNSQVTFCSGGAGGSILAPPPQTVTTNAPAMSLPVLAGLALLLAGLGSMLAWKGQVSGV